MKPIDCAIIINGFSTRKDGSLSGRFETPELTSMEKVAFMECAGKNLRMILAAMDEQNEELVKVKGSTGKPTPSQKQRQVLFRLWKQEKPKISFDEFYLRKMAKNLEYLEGQIKS